MSKLLKYKILQLKNEKGISMMDIATKCQVNLKTAYNWANIEKNSEQKMPADELKILAELFGVTMEDMFTEDKHYKIRKNASN